MTTAVASEIVAEIVLLPTTEGGKQSPITAGEYRGVLGVSGEHFSFRLSVSEGQQLSPGSSGRFGIQFLFPDAALPHFTIGTEFTVWEGRVVGHGSVIEVMPNKAFNSTSTPPLRSGAAAS